MRIEVKCAYGRGDSFSHGLRPCQLPQGGSQGRLRAWNYENGERRGWDAVSEIPRDAADV